MSNEDYVSNWEWCRERSTWHFDNDRYDQPGEWFSILGRMEGDWSQDLAQATGQDLKTITWATRKDTPYYQQADGTFKQSDMLAQEEYDLEVTGAGRDLKLSDVVEYDEFGPELKKIVDFWAVDQAWCRLHIQRPGQMFNLHIDKLWDYCPEDPSQIIRIIVFLADWTPGQFFCHGTHTLDHWKAGDVMTFDWPNVPHASANASRDIRPTLMITGVKSQRTRELLAAANPNNKYKLN
jgi:hypothetical protein